MMIAAARTSSLSFPDELLSPACLVGLHQVESQQDRGDEYPVVSGGRQQFANGINVDRLPIAARRGKKRALVALGHTVLVIVYHLLTRREPYRDLGPTHFDERDRQQVEQRLVRRLQRLGYTVNLEPLAA